MREGDEDPEAFHAVPGNNRVLQKRRRQRRRLFGTKAKAAFLESFACTANVAASAAAIGFSEGVVFTHRRSDPEFRELFWIALEQATGKLAALRVQREIERAEGRLESGLEAAMDGPPDARQIADLVKLMAALRDLTRNLSGLPHPGGRMPDHAGIAEVCSALAKRLKAFPPSPEASADDPPSPEASADEPAVEGGSLR
jgi:hypothetical protein